MKIATLHTLANETMLYLMNHDVSSSSMEEAIGMAFSLTTTVGEVQSEIP